METTSKGSRHLELDERNAGSEVGLPEIELSAGEVSIRPLERFRMRGVSGRAAVERRGIQEEGVTTYVREAQDLALDLARARLRDQGERIRAKLRSEQIEALAALAQRELHTLVQRSGELARVAEQLDASVRQMRLGEDHEREILETLRARYARLRGLMAASG